MDNEQPDINNNFGFEPVESDSVADWAMRRQGTPLGLEMIQKAQQVDTSGLQGRTKDVEALSSFSGDLDNKAAMADVARIAMQDMGADPATKSEAELATQGKQLVKTATDQYIAESGLGRINKPLTEESGAISFAKETAKGFGKGVNAGLAGVIGLTGDAAEYLTGESPGSTGLRSMEKFFQENQDAYDQILKVDPEFEQSVVGQLAAGAGQLGSTLAFSAIGGGAAGVLGKAGVAAMTTSAGMQGANLAVATALGVGAEYNDAFNRALSMGYSKEEARAMAQQYAPAGALDAVADLTAARILKPFVKVAEAGGKLGKVGKVLMSKPGSIAAATAIEGGTEGVQQFYQNLVVGAEDAMEGVGTSALVGSILGGGVSAVGLGVEAADARLRKAAGANLQAGNTQTAEALAKIEGKDLGITLGPKPVTPEQRQDFTPGTFKDTRTIQLGDANLISDEDMGYLQSAKKENATIKIGGRPVEFDDKNNLIHSDDKTPVNGNLEGKLDADVTPTAFDAVKFKDIIKNEPDDTVAARMTANLVRAQSDPRFQPLADVAKEEHFHRLFGDAAAKQTQLPGYVDATLDLNAKHQGDATSAIADVTAQVSENLEKGGRAFLYKTDKDGNTVRYDVSGVSPGGVVKAEGLSDKGGFVKIDDILKDPTMNLRSAQPVSPKTEGANLAMAGEIAEATPAPVTPATTPVTAPAAEPQGKVPTTVDTKRPVVELPVGELEISRDVPQFKKGANEKGVVEPLGGEYVRDPLQPIMVWERTDGRREVISGRHRLDLAQRSGETTIPAQVWKESEGATAKHMMYLDAASNIRDGQGSITDYATFFRQTGLDETRAQKQGLLSRAKGRAGFYIGKLGSDPLFDALRNERITEPHAAAIAKAAPNDEATQRALMGRSIPTEAVANWVSLLKKEKAAAPAETQGDLFGSSDEALNRLDQITKAAAQKSQELSKDIKALTDRRKDPALSAKHGIDLSKPSEVAAKVTELRAVQAKLADLGNNPDVVASLEAGETPGPRTRDLEVATEAPASQKLEVSPAGEKAPVGEELPGIEAAPTQEQKQEEPAAPKQEEPTVPVEEPIPSKLSPDLAKQLLENSPGWGGIFPVGNQTQRLRSLVMQALTGKSKVSNDESRPPAVKAALIKEFGSEAAVESALKKVAAPKPMSLKSGTTTPKGQEHHSRVEAAVKEVAAKHPGRKFRVVERISGMVKSALASIGNISKGKLKALGIEDSLPAQHVLGTFPNTFAGISNAKQFSEAVASLLPSIRQDIRNGKFLNTGFNEAAYEAQQGRKLTDSEKAKMLSDMREKQQALQNNWVDYLETGGYSPEVQALILGTITKEIAEPTAAGKWKFRSLGGNAERLPDAASPELAARVAERLTQPDHKSKRIAQIIAESAQEAEQSRRSDKEQVATSTDDGGSITWVRFPSKKNDPENFDKNVQDLTSLAKTSAKFGKCSWCTGDGAAQGQLENGDFWIGVDENGNARTAIRMEGDGIAEIRGVLEGQNLEPKYAGNVTQFVKEQKLEGGEEFLADAQIKGALQQFENGEISWEEFKEALPESYYTSREYDGWDGIEGGRMAPIGKDDTSVLEALLNHVSPDYGSHGLKLGPKVSERFAGNIGSMEVETQVRIADTSDNPEWLREVYESDLGDDTNTPLSSNRATPSDVLTKLYEEGGYEEQISSNPNTPPTTLDAMAAEDSALVLSNVSENKSTHPETLARLAGLWASSNVDKKERLNSMAWNLSRNPNMPGEALSELYKGTSDRHQGIRERIAENPSTPTGPLKELLKDYPENVSRNPSASQELIDAAHAIIISEGGWAIKKEVAQGPRASGGTLDILSTDSNDPVRMAVAGNPNTTAKTLERLAEMTEAYQVREAAQAELARRQAAGLPAGAQAAISPDANVEAYYDPATNELVFVSENISSPARAKELFFHEATHGNVALMESTPEAKEELDDIFDRSAAALKAETPTLVKAAGFSSLEEMAKAYGYDLKTTDGNRKMQGELLSRMAERLANEANPPTWWQRLLSDISAWLKEFFGINMNSKDVMAFLRKKMETVQDGAPVGTEIQPSLLGKAKEAVGAVKGRITKVSDDPYVQRLQNFLAQPISRGKRTKGAQLAMEDANAALKKAVVIREDYAKQMGLAIKEAFGKTEENLTPEEAKTLRAAVFTKVPPLSPSQISDAEIAGDNAARDWAARNPNATEGQRVAGTEEARKLAKNNALLNAGMQNRATARAATDAALASLPEKAQERVAAIRDIFSRALPRNVYSVGLLLPGSNVELGNKLGDLKVVETYKIRGDKALAEEIKKNPELMGRAVAWASEAWVHREASNIQRGAREDGRTVSREDAVRTAQQRLNSGNAQRTIENFVNMAVKNPSSAYQQTVAKFLELTQSQLKGGIPEALSELLKPTDSVTDIFRGIHSQVSEAVVLRDMVENDIIPMGLAEGWLLRTERGAPQPDIPMGYASAKDANVGIPGWSEMMGDIVASPVFLKEMENSYKQVQEMGGLLSLFQQAVIYSQKAQTVYSWPRGAIRNYFGNPLFLVAAGANPALLFGYPGGATKNDFKVAFNITNDAEVRELLLEAIGYGMAKDELLTQTAAKWSAETKAWRESKTQVIPKKVKDATASFDAAATQFYQAPDTIAKLTLWKSEQAMLRKAYPSEITDRKGATHQVGTAGYDKAIKAAAADRVKTALPSDGRGSALFRFMKQPGINTLMGFFSGFPLEVVRVGHDNMELALKDIRSGNKTLAKAGYKRLAGTTVVSAILPVVAMTAAAIAGIDWEEEEAFRQTLPEWDKNASLLMWRSGDKISYVNLSFTDPSSLFSDNIRAARRTFSSSDKEFPGAAADALAAGFGKFFQGFTEPQMAPKFVAEVYANSANGRQVYNPESSRADIMGQLVEHASKSFSPGIIRQGTQIMRAIPGFEDKEGNRQNAWVAGLNFLALKANTAQPATSFKYGMYEINRRLRDSSRLLTSAVKPGGILTPGVVSDLYSDANQANFNVLSQAARLYRSQLVLGTPEAELTRMMKDAAIPSAVQKQIKTGVISPYKLSTTMARKISPQEKMAIDKAVKSYKPRVANGGIMMSPRGSWTPRPTSEPPGDWGG